MWCGESGELIMRHEGFRQNTSSEEGLSSSSLIHTWEEQRRDAALFAPQIMLLWPSSQPSVRSPEWATIVREVCACNYKYTTELLRAGKMSWHSSFHRFFPSRLLFCCLSIFDLTILALVLLQFWKLDAAERRKNGKRTHHKVKIIRYSHPSGDLVCIKI